ncbi:MAG: dehydrogenase [Monoraphidium minutum]|nr:MAG: dehydrogenase [Monoraphidium minutum]
MLSAAPLPPRRHVARAQSGASDAAAPAAPPPPEPPAAAPAAVADPRLAALGKIFVAGATGGTGACVVRALRARGGDVRALARDAGAAVPKLPQVGEGLEIVEGDVMDYPCLAAAMQGCGAAVIATGARDPRDPLGPLNVDYNGTLNLVEAAKRAGVGRVVLVSSIGADDLLNPLNLFWGVLLWKKQAELALARSGLTFTVVRPGGLKSALRAGEASAGNVIMGRPGFFGFPPKRSGSILRSQVADVCVEALVCGAAADKVVEVVAEAGAPATPLEELFAAV